MDMDLYAVTMMPATDDVRTVVSAMRCSTSAMRAWERIREEGNDGALTGQQCKDGYRPGRGNRLGERARRRIYELCRENAMIRKATRFLPAQEQVQAAEHCVLRGCGAAPINTRSAQSLPKTGAGVPVHANTRPALSLEDVGTQDHPSQALN